MAGNLCSFYSALFSLQPGINYTSIYSSFFFSFFNIAFWTRLLKLCVHVICCISSLILLHEKFSAI